RGSRNLILHTCFKRARECQRAGSAPRRLAAFFLAATPRAHVARAVDTSALAWETDSSRLVAFPRLLPPWSPLMPTTSRRIALLIVFGLPLLAAGLWPSAAGEKTKTEIVATLKGHTDQVYAVAFSNDGKYLVTASFDHTLKLWEAGT